MPAKRSPKKSRKPSPSLADVTPTDLEALTVAPVVGPVALPALAGATPPAPPKAGPPAGPDARLAGRSQRAGRTRFYAFRRS
ncbi:MULTISPECIES: hypothetical protein [Micromonospora]|uniref:Uncharacterized protein n=1 Tax=Micromonospora solifontis TaxID=2487138 RepID=A0ABX9WLJ8_9ACTN|nr:MULTISPECIES: hypothetical protein [Micromonospora]NES17033.1 hypothetical protein [Micromonospora sp. PPF5-17B]NES36400.1 hypothetical protein [Micromonospora solifontis]NES58750.1 hypothetical protein [Micromonospora sp. PPF5-6]RNL99635.1 hypothetical protein EFE23_09520 [Micromonospora solifontis]